MSEEITPVGISGQFGNTTSSW